MSATTVAQSYAPFVETSANATAQQICEAMDERGYVFVRGLVPEEKVLQVRREVLELCSEAGWLDSSCDLMEGIAAPGHEPLSEGMPEYMKVYRQILRLPSFHDYPCQSEFIDIAQKLLPGRVLVHPRRIGRITFPNYQVATTPPHQDHFYIRGTVETYSCWTPLGSCPMELGALAVSPGSHKSGFIEHSVFQEGAVGGRAVALNDDETLWHCSDFGLGDTLFFHAYTIHKALPNLTADQLRVSTDNRYQVQGEAIDESSLKPHLEFLKD